MRVFSNTAVSADGRIATVKFDHVRLGDEADLAAMSEIRAKADAVFVGGRSFRNYAQPLVERSAHRVARPRPMVNAVLTRRGILDASIERRRWEAAGAELWIFGSDEIDRDAHEAIAARVLTTASPSASWVLDTLGAEGLANVLVEGGGDVLFQLLAANRLDEMYVTHCPWIIGGVGAPSLCDGAGFDADAMRRLELLDMHASGSELFLHYRVLHAETAHGAR
jgi:5-amino-6-(5-phosphoribosylamino)uracil reductase